MGMACLKGIDSLCPEMVWADFKLSTIAPSLRPIQLSKGAVDSRAFENPSAGFLRHQIHNAIPPESNNGSSNRHAHTIQHLAAVVDDVVDQFAVQRLR